MDKEVIPKFQLELDPDFDIMNDYTPEKMLERAKNFNPVTAYKPELEKPLFVVDFDQVLVRIDIKWIKTFIRKYPEYFEKELGISFEEGFKFYNSVKNITERTEYYVNKFLKIEEQSPYLEKCFNLYRNDPEFYDDLTLTTFGKNIQTIFKKEKIRLYIVSHCITRVDAESKKRCIERLFPDAEYNLIKSGLKKSDVINNKRLHYYFTFIDDSLKNIEDVFENTYSVSKSFGLPVYGYNEDYEYLLDPMEKNLSTLDRFEVD